MAQCLNRVRSIPGFTLIELVGLIAVLAILAAVLIPNSISRLFQQAEDTEQAHLEHIAKGIKVYLEKNLAFPPSLASLLPDYVSYPTAQLTSNDRGYPRYYFVHPTMNSFSNASGLSSSDVDDARFLLISNLTQDEAPTMTNASEFETLWTTNESATPGLHIYRGNMGDMFYQLTITADGSGASYQLDGTATNSGGLNLATHIQHHLIGTGIRFDEADTYAAPEVSFALTTNVAYWFDPNCIVGKQWNPIDPECNPSYLWISTDGSTSGTPGITWGDDDIVKFDNPNLSYESGPSGSTDGTFSLVFSLDDFGSSTDIDAIHYVSSAVTVGSSGTVDLLEGDLLLSTKSDESLTSTNSLSVKDEDVFVFRPDTAGDYSSGTFLRLIDGSDISMDDVKAVTLVEQNTAVGGTILAKGDLLISDEDDDVFRLVLTSAGSTTSGTLTKFIDGSDIRISEDFQGIDLVEVQTTVGDVSLEKGQILATFNDDDSSVGDNGISTKRHDIVVLDLTSTGNNTVGVATLLFDGSEVSLTSDGEKVVGLALAQTFPTP